MKLAILGSSPIALEAALRFHLHGASLTWFNSSEVEYEAYFQKYLAAGTYTSETGLQHLKEKGLAYSPGPEFSFENWKKHYYLALVDLLKSEQKVCSHQVVSLSKRYLAPFESIEGRSRFYDLFRIIFQVSPQDFIKEQEKTNPETFERLSTELVESLQTNLEMYEDFDLVIDMRRAVRPGSLSITGRALGEGKVSAEHLKCGFEALKLAQEINSDAQEVRELALVGSGALAAEILLSLGEWLKDQRSRIFVVSEEAWPFADFLEHGESTAVKKLKDLFHFMDNEFEKEVTEFHHKWKEWQELDDFVQAKKPKPVEPIPRLVYFSGHNATAVDQLVDKRRLFLTLEKPDFREGHKQPDNNALDLKTIGTDRILVATKLQRPAMEIHLVPAETGFYICELTLPNIDGGWTKDLERLKGIEHEIFKLFSPADAH